MIYGKTMIYWKMFHGFLFIQTGDNDYYYLQIGEEMLEWRLHHKPFDTHEAISIHRGTCVWVAPVEHFTLMF